VEKKEYVTVVKVVETDTELKKMLEFKQYVVTREKGTEEPYSGQYVDTREKGVYRCVCCGNDLFLSDIKYDSGTGWPTARRYYAAGAMHTRDTYSRTARSRPDCGIASIRPPWCSSGCN